MTKSKKQQETESEDAIMERMNKALKRTMDTPPETHKEMVERRRIGGGTRKGSKKSA